MRKPVLFIQASHEAVREWYQKGRELFEGLMEKKRRKWIAVDEKVIAVWVSFGRSGLETMAFLKKVKHACKGKLPRIFIDGGSWYPWALERVGFERHTVISFGSRSAIERLFGDIEKRIRQFWNGFIGTYTRKGMERWVEAFAGFRNWKKDLKGVLS